MLSVVVTWVLKVSLIWVNSTLRPTRINYRITWAGELWSFYFFWKKRSTATEILKQQISSQSLLLKCFLLNRFFLNVLSILKNVGLFMNIIQFFLKPVAKLRLVSVEAVLSHFCRISVFKTIIGRGSRNTARSCFKKKC